MLTYKQVIEHCGERAYHTYMSGSMNSIFYNIDVELLTLIYEKKRTEIIKDVEKVYYNHRFGEESWDNFYLERYVDYITVADYTNIPIIYRSHPKVFTYLKDHPNGRARYKTSKPGRIYCTKINADIFSLYPGLD